MEVLLVRHGKTLANEKYLYASKTDYELTICGIKLLKKIDYKYDLIIVSPLKRCVQTAMYMFDCNQVIEAKSLVEIDFGDFENKSHSQLCNNKNYQLWKKDYFNNHIPNGEKFVDFQSRVINYFEKYILQSSLFNKKIVVVTHGGVIKTIVEKYCNQNFGTINIKCGQGYIMKFKKDFKVVWSGYYEE